MAYVNGENQVAGAPRNLGGTLYPSTNCHSNGFWDPKGKVTSKSFWEVRKL